MWKNDPVDLDREVFCWEWEKDLATACIIQGVLSMLLHYTWHGRGVVWVCLLPSFGTLGVLILHAYFEGFWG